MSLPRPGRCLGDKIADLADGRLEPAAAERAHAHVALCPACRTALETQREVRSRLAQSDATPGAAPDDLIARLRDLATGPADGAPGSGIPDVTIPAQPGAGVRRPARAAGTRPWAPSSSSRPRGARRRPGRRVALASAAGAAALAVAAVVGGGSAALSGPASPAPSIAPVVDRLTYAHTTSADRMPLSGPRVLTASYAVPSGSASAQP